MRAWKRFRKGKRSKSDVRIFELRLEDNIVELHERLVWGIWKPDPYKVFYVQDPKLRKIHKASVRDRVLYQALYQVLYSVFDRGFIHDSYASRDNKGTHKGVHRFVGYARKVSRNYTRPAFVLKCDIRKFFDSIDHDILVSLIQKKITDLPLITLLKNIIDSYHISPHKGLPLGNVTSQIFANIYLNELDHFCKNTLKTRYYIRYCDDFVIAHSSRVFLEQSIHSVRSFLHDRLLLQLHRHKVQIRKLHTGVDFLGYVSMPQYIVLRTNTKKRIVRKIDRLKSQLEKGSLDPISFNQSMQSYLGTLSHCKCEHIKCAIERIFYD